MESLAFVQLALQTLGCSQKELALRLGVSQAQISKWKNGEHMSTEMEAKLRSISQLTDTQSAEFVLWAGSVSDALKWEKLLSDLAETASFSAETGFDTYWLEEEEERPYLFWLTFHVLREMGVVIPKPFPNDLDFDYDSADVDDMCDRLDANPYAELIRRMYKSFTDVVGFYNAYISDLMDDDGLDLHSTSAANIEAGLLALAASKLEDVPKIAENFQQFKRRTEKNFKEWITIVKDRAFRAGIPLRAELLGLVYDSHDELGQEAEAESLGFNGIRVHPDIYMNELLCGMRVIHQVLPAIMKKLGIDEEFKLDESAFWVGRLR